MPCKVLVLLGLRSWQVAVDQRAARFSGAWRSSPGCSSGPFVVPPRSFRPWSIFRPDAAKTPARMQGASTSHLVKAGSPGRSRHCRPRAGRCRPEPGGCLSTAYLSRSIAVQGDHASLVAHELGRDGRFAAGRRQASSTVSPAAGAHHHPYELS